MIEINSIDIAIVNKVRGDRQQHVGPSSTKFLAVVNLVQAATCRMAHLRVPAQYEHPQ